MNKNSAMSTIPCIPLDIFGVVAEWLVAQDLYGTCAALNTISKHVQDETRPVLWRRVLYRFNNGPSNKKKAGIKWRTMFGSVGAEYIQYLTIIPSITPDFGDPDSDNPNAPWEPPFLELITSRHNKLKACLVPGTLSTVSITLFSGYQMCSTDLYEAMACGERLRRMIGRQIAVASIRMYKQSRTDTGEVDDQELAAAFVKHHTNLAKMTVLPVQFWHVSLVLTRHEVLSPAFLTRLSVDFILWHDIGVYICCDPAKTSEQQKEMSRSMHLLVYVEQFEQAITFGRALAAAYRSNARFACLWVRVSTRSPFTEEQSRRFLGTVEQSYLMTSPFFVIRHPGIVALQDFPRIEEEGSSIGLGGARRNDRVQHDQGAGRTGSPGVSANQSVWWSAGCGGAGLSRHEWRARPGKR